MWVRSSGSTAPRSTSPRRERARRRTARSRSPTPRSFPSRTATSTSSAAFASSIMSGGRSSSSPSLARVARRGGLILLVDQLGDVDPLRSLERDRFERVRDPSHTRLLSDADIRGSIEANELVVNANEIVREHRDLEPLSRSRRARGRRAEPSRAHGTRLLGDRGRLVRRPQALIPSQGMTGNTALLKRAELAIDGMSCGACAERVERTLNGLDGRRRDRELRDRARDGCLRPGTRRGRRPRRRGRACRLRRPPSRDGSDPPARRACAGSQWLLSSRLR